MAKGQDGSVAPKERINISFKPAGSDKNEEVELPLKILVLGEFEGEDAPDYKEGETFSVDNNNFDEVMENFGVKLNYRVPNKIVDDPNAVMDINIDAKSTKAFAPDNILQNTASLRKVLELKQALIALKGPLGNTPAMRRKIKDIFNNEKRRQALKTELESSGSIYPMGKQLQHKKED